MRSALLRTISAALCLSLITGSCPALAQKGGKNPAPEPAAPEDPKLVEAKQHMAAGAAFYNDPSGHKCEEAYREFRKAFDLSGSPNAVKGMGLCAMELERDGEAINLLEKFLEARGDQLDPAEKEQMETDLKALKSAVVWVTFKTDKPGVTLVDTRTPSRGFPVTNRYTVSVTGTKLGIHPGVHEFKASVDDKEQVWKVELANGSEHDHEFEFEKGKPVTAEGFKPDDLGAHEEKQPEKVDRPVPGYVYAVGGASLAAALGGAVVGGVLATNAKSDYDKANGREDRATLEDMRSKVVTLNVVADVCFGVAVAGAATTLVLFLTRPAKKTPEPPADGAVSFAPWATPYGGGATLVGSF
jgi:hypothetical protein